MPQPTESTAAGRATSAPRADSKNMLPPRERRRSPFERVFVRIIATCGIVAIGVAIGAIMTSSGSAGWLIGLVVAIVSVVLAAVLWSSRQL
jgi:protein-S-isoprenylcysteine O-methyltransferase Ste14